MCLGEGQSRQRWLCLYVVGRYKYTHTTVMSVCVFGRGTEETKVAMSICSGQV